MSDVAVLVQARMGSTRLPGKVTMRIGDATMLEHVVIRARMAGFPVYVVPPAGDVDVFRPLVSKYAGLPSMDSAFTGDEADVLGRFAHFVATDRRLAGTYALVRVTADCPFLDPMQVRMAGEMALAGRPSVYVSNTTWDRPVDGWDVEAFSHGLLFEADRQCEEPSWREHVTPWMKVNAIHHYSFDRHVKVMTPTPHEPYRHKPQYRWTVDTEEDLDWARRVHKVAGDLWPPHPHTDKMLDIMRTYPELRRTTE